MFDHRPSARALFLALGLTLTLAACGDETGTGGDNAANPTPPENVSEADPQGVGGTSNR